jgi:hypothetical protein
MNMKQLLADFLPPLPIPPGTKFPGPGRFERNLLAEPLSFATYEEAMRAAFDCDNRHDLPGDAVKLFAISDSPPGPFSLQITWSYTLIIPRTKSSGNAASATGAPSPTNPQQYIGPEQYNPTEARQYALWDSCFMKYAQAMDKRWLSRGSLDSQQIASQRPAFLGCMIAAGVEISRSAGISQILDTFDSPNWYKPLTPAQYKQANACMSKYSGFMRSLGAG